MPVIKPKAKSFPMFWYPPKGNLGLGAWCMGRITQAWNTEEKISAKGAKYTNYSLHMKTACLVGDADGNSKQLDIVIGGSNLSVLEDIFPHMPAGKGRAPTFPEIGMYFGACYLTVDGSYAQPEFCYADTEVAFLADFNNAFIEQYRAVMGDPEATAWDKITSWHDGQPNQLREYCEKNGIPLTGDNIPF